ncbi:MAG: hypothetical protein KA286_03705 [Burkholderiales bacterium]|nr:hypothetical protein [Burkholderiales bacterium]
MMPKGRSDDASPGASREGRPTPARRDATAAGMPGLRGNDHVGFTVPDRDEAVR